MDIKLTGNLYQQILQDLQRPHPFAEERIGFVLGRLGTSAGRAQSILLTRYLAIPDNHYLDDSTVGARIGPEAMTAAMQAVHSGRKSGEGIFHIHLHASNGRTGMSLTDRREIPPLIPGFQGVGRKAAHGIIILSLNHGTGWVWPPDAPSPVQVETLSVIGTPIRVFRKEGGK